MGPDPSAPSSADPAQTDPDAAYAAWRSQRLREFDEDYAAWRQTGARIFPPDFDSWRQARRELIIEQSTAGLPLVAAGDTPEGETAPPRIERP